MIKREKVLFYVSHTKNKNANNLKNKGIFNGVENKNLNPLTPVRISIYFKPKVKKGR